MTPPQGHADGPGHVWVDGSVLPADGAHVSAFDRGFQLGDGVFETLRARSGRPTELAEHLARLRRSADGLGIALPDDLDARIGAGIAALLAAEGLDGPAGDASIRVTVTRGPSRARGLLPPEGTTGATVAIGAWPVSRPASGHLERGLHLVTSAVRRDPAHPLATLKTTSRAEYVYARLEARRAGGDDAVFLTLDGHLSEATSANIFLLARSGGEPPELATPGLDCAILPGTTRSWLLDWGRRVGLRTREDRLTPAELAGADEAFISSSVAGILPVTRLDGRPIGRGVPGPWTLRARADREAMIRGGGSEPVEAADR